MVIIVEGGSRGQTEGPTKKSDFFNSELRQAFHSLLKKAGVCTMPRIVVAGGRAQAYDRFQTCTQNGENVVLLVDSEKAVPKEYNDKPWDFLKTFESWAWLEKLDNSHCHLMVQCMESWFFADKEKLKQYYKNGFREKKLLKGPIEELSTDRIIESLENATRECKTKKGYDKSRDSAKILRLLDPNLIKNQSYWANRFFVFIKEMMGAE